MLESTWLEKNLKGYKKLFKNIRQHVIFKHRNNTIIPVKVSGLYTKLNTTLNIP